MTGTRWHTSKCAMMDCKWVTEDRDEARLPTLEAMHTSITGHVNFNRGTRLHTDDEIIGGDDQMGSRRVVEIPERANREGDNQPMPVGNDQPVIFDLVIADLNRRQAIGVQRYGQPLQPHNGRDALVDTYEELLDAAVYIRQVIYERDNPA